MRILMIVALIISFSANADEFMGVSIAKENNWVFEPDNAEYKRNLYKHWIDDDSDGIKTRDEVLIAESLIDPTVIGGKVKRGLWVGPYTGLVTTNPRDLQIDHMVPLKEVHESGGHSWTEEKRRDYANDLSDPQHLIAVKGGANGSKGARDPAEWMPPNRSYWCTYLEDWLTIKRRWQLTIDQARGRCDQDRVKGMPEVLVW